MIRDAHHGATDTAGARVGPGAGRGMVVVRVLVVTVAGLGKGTNEGIEILN